MTSPLLIHLAQVHIWHVQLEPLAQSPEPLEQALAPAELERAAQLQFAQDRRRFVVGRSVLRQLLGKYLGVDARQICFEYGPHGKPHLPADQNPLGLRFNVSHSAAAVAMAFARGAEVGIDIEHVRHLENMERLAAYVFAREELAAWTLRPVTLRVEDFFARWTRSEALAKGVGLGWSMNRMPGLPPAAGTGRAANHTWDVRNLDVCLGYAVAVAVEGSGARLWCFEWPGDA